jgi:hypothetical protein
VSCGMEDIVRFIVEAGADPNYPSKPFGYPILCALSYGHYRVARLLVSLGARWDREVWENRSEEFRTGKFLEWNEKGCCKCGNHRSYEGEVGFTVFDDIGGYSHRQQKEERPLDVFKAMIGVE